MFPFFEKIRKDSFFRTKLFLKVSFILNVGFSAFLLTVSRINFSKWFFVMSIYYVLLSLSRILVFLQINPEKKLISKIKTMRLCGCFLLLINLAVSTMMFILVYRGHYVKHHEITVIALAAYTFFSLTVAIISSVKHLKKNDYVFSSAKIISLTSASVSLVTLTNTMLTTFGESNLALRNVVMPLLSGSVSVFIIVGAIIMICKANSDLRTLKNENKG